MNQKHEDKTEKKADQLLSSNYDGIQEYDNDLPRWWIQLFYLTIVFGIIYFIYMQFIRVGTSEEIAINEARAVKELGTQVAANNRAPVASATDLTVLVKDSAVIEKGKGVYTTKCAACHGMNGEGLIGPNLTDRYTIHGGSITQIEAVIENGVLDKGMLAWKGVLKNDEVDAVVAYIHSIKDTNPANPKAPQGDLSNEQ